MAIFSVTDIRTYRRCRRQWDYSSNARQNLTKIGTGSPALELGSLIHKALAQWILEYKPNEKLGTLAAIFISHFNKRFKEIEEEYETRLHAKLGPTERGPLLDLGNIGMAMMMNYQKRWKSPIQDDMKFAAAEQEIIIDVPGTEHYCDNCVRLDREQRKITIHSDTTASVNEDCKECNGKGFKFHQLRATLDGLLQHNSGRLYVLEHKTYDNKPKEMYLRMDDQFTGYAWVVSQLNIGVVGGIAYDGLWKRAEVTSRMKATEEDLFMRLPIRKNAEQLEEWGKHVAEQINEMANNPAIYPNVPWQGCFDCGFTDLCEMEMRQEDISSLLKVSYKQRDIERVQGVRN